MNRDYESLEFGTKWLTDVTEMKYGNQNKANLSAILRFIDVRLFSWWGIPTTMNLYLKLLISPRRLILTLYPFHSDRGFNDNT
ncbi:hypothetical protein P7H25_21220 [Paenibacillus larvae]|nr:hypothetical protein [Paenibacillus larvae]MDT2257575.1 hypothetical protein [Paenibacillus larvae]